MLIGNSININNYFLLGTIEIKWLFKLFKKFLFSCAKSSW